jgi:hypothetical protein
MPEPLLLVQAIVLAAVLAGIVQLLAWWIVGAVGAAVLPKNAERQQTRSCRLAQTRVAVGGALGIGIGFVAGAWTLGQWPHWPPVEDRDRFLAVLLPVAIFVECLAALPSRRRWLAWGMRLVLSAATAPMLLYATTYVVELAGSGSREWTNREMTAWLMGMAAALAVVWMAAIRLLRTNSGRLLPFALAITAGAAGVTIMLSGYLTGGELGLPLAGAIGGAALAALGLRMLKCNEGALSVGIVGLFSLLVMGRFFGALTTLHGGILLAASLLVCLPELMPRKRLSSWLQGMLAIAIFVISIAFVVMQAREKFVQSSAPASSPGEATADDYMEYK